MVVNLAYNFLTNQWPESWPFVQGALFIAVVLVIPDGLISVPRRILSWMKSHRRNGKDEAASGPVGVQTVPGAEVGP
jgi:urea transport system permease protein